MSVTKTIGGDRLGSGKKMQTSLNNYGRSTHNLTEPFISSMTCGTLVPFYCNIGVDGDTFDIDLNAMVRTIPTIGPLFGSFKLQLDMFCTPFRLYQAQLHNNALNIGYDMANVKLPMIEISHNCKDDIRQPDYNLSQMSKNCLLRYLGMAGLGVSKESNGGITRQISALPVLAYYDIFKNYYANKQQKDAWVIKPNIIESHETATTFLNRAWGAKITSYAPQRLEITVESEQMVRLHTVKEPNPESIYIMGNSIKSWCEHNSGAKYFIQKSSDDTHWIIVIIGMAAEDDYIIELMDYDIISSGIGLQSFDLTNIDDMRNAIYFNISGDYTDIRSMILAYQDDLYPYKALWEQDKNGRTMNSYNMNGLCVKTYQSDIFNNWLAKDTIETLNGKSNVAVTNGQFSMDSLNLAQKVYELLNRVAVSGGTYDDWREAVWGMEVIRKCETPMYCGGMSSEIVFEEVLATAETESSDNNKLGSIAGKGTLAGRKGGHIIIKVTEPSVIMGIVSITPRIVYSQGNAWYNNLETMDDLHKPQLDGIGFQDLIEDTMAWWTTTYQAAGNKHIFFQSAGKIPAWMNYMTSVGHAYGDFIQKDGGFNYMILQRDYSYSSKDSYTGARSIEDLTTYIDPTKFNTPFAYQDLDSQNFWVQILTKVEARRVMSAKLIPNL